VCHSIFKIVQNVNDYVSDILSPVAQAREACARRLPTAEEWHDGDRNRHEEATMSIGDTEDPAIETLGDTGLLLSVAGAMAIRNANVGLEAIGLRARTFAILELVVRTGGVNQRNLADKLRLNPSQMVALVDTLVADGLVERRQDDEDRRARLVCPTEEGERRWAEARELADRALDRTLRDLTPPERALLHQMLSVVVHASEADH
jgi:DNA-binding MarR family transcriptional regulator